MKRTLALSLAAVSVLTTSAAFADPLETEAGAKGTLAIDQLAGFRASSVDGIGFAGPLGFSISRIAIDTVTAGTTVTTSLKRTAFWLAPSVDYFVIDHLSVGGVVEFSTTSSTIESTAAAASTTVSLPAATNFTIVPRIGYLIPFTDRFSLWPRAGIGFFTRQDPPTVVAGTATAAGSSTSSTSGAIIDLDANFLFRLTNQVFLKAAPTFSVALGANTSRTTTAGTTTTTGPSQSTAFYNFGILGGVGVFLPL